VLVAGAGCGGGKDSAPASSGDPEADHRAELRAGDSSGRKIGSDTRPLYDRLGGEPTIVALVDDLTERSMADPRVNFSRTNVKGSWFGAATSWSQTPENIDRFKRHMVEFLTLASGGPSQYTGRDMRTAHKGMRISNTEFDAMVGDIKTSMDRLKIPVREKRDLLAIVETTRKEIVEKQ